jgi:hypothetical protein
MTWADGVTIGGTRADGAVDRLRFRTPPLRRFLPMLAGPIGAVGGAVMAGALHADAFMLSFLLKFTAAGLIIGLPGAFFNGRGITLTPEALTVHRFRSRTFLWPEIAGLTIHDGVMGSRQIVVHTVDGRRIKLISPLGGFLGDPRFLDKFHTVGQWWLAGRARSGHVAFAESDLCSPPTIV